MDEDKTTIAPAPSGDAGVKSEVCLGDEDEDADGFVDLADPDCYAPISGSNTPPVIESAWVSDASVLSRESVQFHAAAHDIDGDPLSYTWDFDDGFTQLGSDVVHYMQGTIPARVYNVLLSVSDGRGGVATASLPVSVLTSPPRALSLLDENGQPAWTVGTKTLLVMVLRFSDYVPPAPLYAGLNTALTALDDFYLEVSNGQLGFVATVVEIDLGRPTSDYITSGAPLDLYYDARRLAGVDLNAFDHDMIVYPGAMVGSPTPTAFTQSKGIFIPFLVGSYDLTGTIRHETGHALGFSHSNTWTPVANSVTGAGSMLNYGCPWDVMAYSYTSHMNVYTKHRAGWLSATQSTLAESDGAYDLFAHDLPNLAPDTPYGIEIPREDRSYWLELRSSPAANQWLGKGVVVTWSATQFTGGSPVMLDPTPLTSESKAGPAGSHAATNDNVLVLGQTLSDWQASPPIHITPTSVIDDQTGRHAKIEIRRGAFAGNQPPTINALTPGDGTAYAVTATVPFAVSATDPDGDTLAYFWDFGDGTAGTANSPQVNHKYASAGQYFVRVVVSDMKGAHTSWSRLVRIGTQTTFVVSGTVMQGPQPIRDAIVLVGGGRAVTDTNGRFVVGNLSPGTHDISVAAFSLTFAAKSATIVAADVVSNLSPTSATPTAPSLGSLADIVTTEDQPSDEIDVSVSDTMLKAPAIVVSAYADDTTLIPRENIAFLLGVVRKMTVFPAKNASGQTTLHVQAWNGSLTTTRDVDVVVNAVDDPPIARGDQVVATGALSVSAPGVLANDDDEDHTVLSAHLVRQAAFGHVALGLDGSFVYVPNPLFHGDDSFSYQAQGGPAYSEVAAVHVHVP